MRAALIVAGMLIAGVSLAQAAAPGDDILHDVPLHVGGRVAPDGRHQWPGVYYEGAFDGDAVSVDLKDDRNSYNIYLDGRFVRRVKTGAKVAVTAGDGGRHVVRVELANETTDAPAATGTLQVREIHRPGLDDVNLPLPAPGPRSRQIEIIGDSYAAGYGVLSTRHDCTPDEIRDTTDTSQTFGVLLARRYDADYQVNAYSGIGMVRNYGGGDGPTLPDLYPYSLFDRTTAYADPKWQPRIIVIALGDNDFATSLATGETWPNETSLRQDFIAAYVAFVEGLHRRDPKASFILMDFNELTLPHDILAVIARLKADGEKHVVAFSPGGSFEQTGCDWHLSLNDHRRIADGLAGLIEAHPELWHAH